MNTPELKIEQLQWQLDLLGNLEPAILGSTIESYGFHLSVKQENWAAEVLEFFACRCFEGFESFLVTIEEKYDKANKPIGVVEAQIFREWWELRKRKLRGRGLTICWSVTCGSPPQIGRARISKGTRLLLQGLIPGIFSKTKPQAQKMTGRG